MKLAALKKAFLGRPARERTLLLVFIGLIAIAWLGSLSGRSIARFREWQSVRADLKTQALWLANKNAITDQSAAAVARLDPKRTFDGTHLVGELNKLASAAGLSASIDSQRTESTDAFAFHSVQLTFRKAELKPLIDFYRTLAERSPYIGLEQFSLAANRATPGQTDVTFRVFSVEVVKGR